MVKENNTQSFSLVVSDWTKVMKECHSRACLAQRRRVFLHEHSLTKISPGLFFKVWLMPSKAAKFNHPQKFYSYGSVCTLVTHARLFAFGSTNTCSNADAVLIAVSHIKSLSVNYSCVRQDWVVMYDTVAILRKSPSQCHTWHVTKSSNCRPCLNFNVYTVDIRVACSLAGFTSSISSCLHTL